MSEQTYQAGCFGFPAMVDEAPPVMAIDAGYELGCFGFPAHVEGAPAVLPRGMGAVSCLRSEWPKPWVTTDMESEERRCNGCHTWKPFDDFSLDQGDPMIQRTRECKECMRQSRSIAA